MEKLIIIFIIQYKQRMPYLQNLCSYTKCNPEAFKVDHKGLRHGRHVHDLLLNETSQWVTSYCYKTI
jgi:hypothetical protein